METCNPNSFIAARGTSIRKSWSSTMICSNSAILIFLIARMNQEPLAVGRMERSSSSPTAISGTCSNQASGGVQEFFNASIRSTHCGLKTAPWQPEVSPSCSKMNLLTSHISTITRSSTTRNIGSYLAFTVTFLSQTIFLSTRTGSARIPMWRTAVRILINCSWAQLLLTQSTTAKEC